MNAFFNAMFSTLPEMPAWILASTGFYFAYRVMKFPDITVDGSFIAGGVAAASLAIHGSTSLGGFFVSILLGLFAGCLTSLVYLLNPKPAYKMLSGIFVVLGLYSIDFRLLDRKVESYFGHIPTEMNWLIEYEIQSGIWLRFFLGVGIVILVSLILLYLLRTNFGLILRTVGSRPRLEGISSHRYLIIGISIANIVVGIGGWFYASINSYARVSIFGTIVHALAISIIGELIVGSLPFLKDKRTSPITILLTPIVGAIVYLFVKASVAFLMIDPDSELISINQQDMNAVVATSLVIVLLFVKFLNFIQNRLSLEDFEMDSLNGEV